MLRTCCLRGCGPISQAVESAGTRILRGQQKGLLDWSCFPSAFFLTELEGCLVLGSLWPGWGEDDVGSGRLTSAYRSTLSPTQLPTTTWVRNLPLNLFQVEREIIPLPASQLHTHSGDFSELTDSHAFVFTTGVLINVRTHLSKKKIYTHLYKYKFMV